MSIDLATARRWAEQWCLEHPGSSHAVTYRALLGELDEREGTIRRRDETIVKLRRQARYTTKGGTRS